jgi:hypothetical protein
MNGPYAPDIYPGLDRTGREQWLLRRILLQFRHDPMDAQRICNQFR